MAEGNRPELCSRCVFAAACATRQRSSGPVLCCDRFAAPNGGAAAGAAGAGGPATPAGPLAKTAGLCRTCGMRDRCTRPHAEGGVWRCADYV